jgi:hypothetical protein
MKRTAFLAVVSVLAYQLISGFIAFRSASATMTGRVAVIESIEGRK